MERRLIDVWLIDCRKHVICKLIIICFKVPGLGSSTRCETRESGTRDGLGIDGVVLSEKIELLKAKANSGKPIIIGVIRSTSVLRFHCGILNFWVETRLSSMFVLLELKMEGSMKWNGWNSVTDSDNLQIQICSTHWRRRCEPLFWKYQNCEIRPPSLKKNGNYEKNKQEWPLQNMNNNNGGAEKRRGNVRICNETRAQFTRARAPPLTSLASIVVMETIARKQVC